MMKIEAIANQVLQNCNIADSQHAGLYSICGLALRLRDLYKWENGLDPWIEKDSAEVLEWIGAKEQIWEELVEKSFNAVTVMGSTYDPFDTSGINAMLEPHGYFYGAGYAQRFKPTFFLAVVENKEKVDGYPIFILGRELARDLLTLPALLQDDCILVRQESAKLYLWDRIFYIKKSGRFALKFALASYGLKDNSPEDLHRNLAAIVAAETKTYIYHELGELRDTIFDRRIWREIVAVFPNTPMELLARTVKDLLADTGEHGTLHYIIRKRKTASLAFYVAFLESLTKELFPEIVDAFREFMHTHQWSPIIKATAKGFQTARYHAEVMTDIFQEGMQKNDRQWIENEVARRLLKPIGVI